jgi:hypothetical protein
MGKPLPLLKSRMPPKKAAAPVEEAPPEIDDGRHDIQISIALDGILHTPTEVVRSANFALTAD